MLAFPRPPAPFQGAVLLGPQGLALIQTNLLAQQGNHNFRNTDWVKPLCMALP